MGSSRLQHTFYQSYITQPFQNGIMGDSTFTNAGIGSINRHLHAVFRMAAYVAYDGAFVLIDMPPDEGSVEAARGLVEELATQRGAGIFGLGYDQEA